MIKSILKLGRQSFIYTLGDVATQVLAFVLVPIYTNVLPADDYGLLGIVSTVQKVLVPLAGLGLSGAVTRFYFDTDNEHQRRHTAGAIWLGWIVLASALAAMLNLAGPSLSKVLFTDIAFTPYFQLALFIAALNALAMIPRALLRAREQPGWFSLLSASSFAANALCIIYFVVYRQQGILGSLRGQLLGNLFMGLVYAILMAFLVDWRWDWALLRPALAFGLPLVPHLVATWALGFSDRWILERHVSLSEIGLYTLAYQFGLAMSMLISSINRAWSPLYYGQARSPEGRTLLSRLVTYYSLAIVSVGLAIALLARPALRLVVPVDYQPAHRLVPIIVAAYAMQGFYFTQTSAILFTKHTRRLPLITSLAALTNIGLNLLLVPRYGVMAAAVNTLVGYCVLFASAFLMARRLFPLNYEYRRIGAIMLVAGLVFAAGYLLQAENPFLDLVIHALCWTLYPLGLLLIRFFTPQELAAARRTITRRARL